MIPKILHQIWLGGLEPPALYRRWAKQLRVLHADWAYQLWTDGTRWDKEVDNLLARCHSQSSKANVARLFVLHRHGGIYLDLDCEIRQNLEPLLQYNAFCAQLHKGPSNAVLGATPGHSWLVWQIDRLSDYVSRSPPWGSVLVASAPPVPVLDLGDYLKHHNHCTWGRGPDGAAFERHLVEGS